MAKWRMMAEQFVCCLFFCLISVTRIFAFTRLEPEKPLLNQVLHHQETVIYHLAQLKPDRSYELRVSYPSTTPTDFHIHVISKEAFGRTSRQLLNIDKLVFKNPLAIMVCWAFGSLALVIFMDPSVYFFSGLFTHSESIQLLYHGTLSYAHMQANNGQWKRQQEQFANVTAIRTGVPLDHTSLADPVIYDIVLEELFFGVPWHVWRLAVLVIFIIFITVKYLVPHALSFMEHASLIKVHEKR